MGRDFKLFEDGILICVGDYEYCMNMRVLSRLKGSKASYKIVEADDGKE